jgi:hypothetical protein
MAIEPNYQLSQEAVGCSNRGGQSHNDSSARTLFFSLPAFSAV